MSNLTKITFFSLLNKLAFRIANQNKLKIEFPPLFFMINLMFSQHLLHVKFNQITCFNLKKTGPKYKQLWLISAEIVAKDQGQILVRAKSSPPKKKCIQHLSAWILMPTRPIICFYTKSFITRQAKSNFVLPYSIQLTSKQPSDCMLN